MQVQSQALGLFVKNPTGAADKPGHRLVKDARVPYPHPPEKEMRGSKRVPSANNDDTPYMVERSCF